MNVSEFLILMVEDEEDQVFLTKHALSRANLVNPVRIVSDGEEAIAYLSGKGAYADRRANPLPSLILLDLKLPRIGGLEVLEWIRAQSHLKNLPVAVLTASINPRDREQADQLGVNAYLCKPVNSEGLLEMMKSIGMYWLILRKNQEVASQAESVPGARRGPNVLLVDPDRDCLVALADGLRRRSPSLLSDQTADPQDALRLLSENAYDAVVVDLEAAAPDESDYLSRIRAARSGVKTFVLCTPGNEPPEERLRKAGVEAVFVKRPRLRDFVDEVHGALCAPPASAPAPAPAEDAGAERRPARQGAGSRQDTEILGDRVRFEKTSWDLVRSAAKNAGMDSLIRAYWKPLYYFVRQKGFDNETAKDIVQGFLTDALERATIAKADPARGKFRTFLLTSLSNFIKDWHKASGRLKRGGGRMTLSLDFDSGERQYALEIASSETPEDALDKSWAMSTLEACMGELQGSPAHLKAFRMITEGASYADVGKETGLSETAAKTAVFRLRQQLRDVLLRKISEAGLTLQDEELAMADFASFLRQA
jgi:RNA polymerase sigma factor (sigma-70 family)